MAGRAITVRECYLAHERQVEGCGAKASRVFLVGVAHDLVLSSRHRLPAMRSLVIATTTALGW